MFESDISLLQALNQTSYQLPKKIDGRESGLNAPVFIVGSPRSGTTMLANCLNQSSEFAGGQESMVMLDMWRVYNDLYKGNNKNGFSPLSSYLSERQLLRNIGSFSDNILSPSLENNQRLLDQTPWYALIIDFIILFYPDAVFVHLIRNGKNVVSSLSQSYSDGFAWAGRDTHMRAHIWKRSVSTARSILSENQKIQSIEVRYEDLWRDPISELKNISNICRITYDETFLAPLTVSHASESSENIIGYYSDQGEFVLNGYKPQIKSNFDETVFKEVAGSLNSLLGY